MPATKEKRPIVPPLCARDVDFHVEIEPECEPYVGNCSAISPEEDAETEEWIREQLAAGNELAWCCVMVDAEPHSAAYGDARGRASCGFCSYENRADMEDLIDDLRDEALADLNQQIAARSKLRLTLEATAEDVRDWLVIPAFEGGSNYWLDTRRIEWDGPDSVRTGGLYNMPFLDGFQLELYVNRESVVTIAGPWALDREQILRGLQLMAEKHPRHWADFRMERADAETADVFLQLALFGELLYG